MSTEASPPEEAAAPKPAAKTAASEEWPEPAELTPDDRFLYVTVGARRAKQLRRGALPRLADLAPDPETGERPPLAKKLERIAMEEVDEQLIPYVLPGPRESEAEGS